MTTPLPTPAHRIPAVPFGRLCPAIPSRPPRADAGEIFLRRATWTDRWDAGRAGPIPRGTPPEAARGAPPPTETHRSAKQRCDGGGRPADAGIPSSPGAALSARSPAFPHRDLRAHHFLRLSLHHLSPTTHHLQQPLFFHHENQYVDRRQPSFQSYRLCYCCASNAPCSGLALLPSAGSTQLRLRAAHEFRAAVLRPPSSSCQPDLPL